MSRYDILILGAGIVGSACAWECARAGLRVAVLERGVVGGATTAAGMGHLVLMDDTPEQLRLTAYSRSLWRELRDQLPAPVEYESCGTLWVAADGEEMSEVHTKRSTYAAIGAHSEVLDAQALREAEPQLRAGLAGALLVPEDAVIYPAAAAAWFLEQARLQGAHLLRGDAVRLEGGRVHLRDGSVLTPGRVLLATGSDTTLLPDLPIQQRKGHLLITDRYPGLVHHQLVELGYLKSAHSLTSDSVAFNVQPRQTGQLLIGSSRQYGDTGSGINHALMNRMLRRAQDYLPALGAVLGIRAWTGFRAATEDKLPLIGPTSESWLVLAMGFEGLGITNAPGAARLAVDVLLARPSSIDPTPYLPTRLAGLTCIEAKPVAPLEAFHA